jgi:hypothetical protein
VQDTETRAGQSRSCMPQTHFAPRMKRTRILNWLLARPGSFACQASILPGRGRVQTVASRATKEATLSVAATIWRPPSGPAG